jgi:hypothetical protein
LTTNTDNVANTGTLLSSFSPTVDTSIEIGIVSVNGGTLTGIGSSASGYPTIVITEASRQATVLNTVDYVFAVPSSSVYSSNTDIPMTVKSGNIVYNNPYFTLKAGKNYNLVATMGFRSSAYAVYQWVDSSNTKLPNSSPGQGCAGSSSDPLAPKLQWLI